jgi:endonuclease YncB( thermonuclease family)
MKMQAHKMMDSGVRALAGGCCGLVLAWACTTGVVAAPARGASPVTGVVTQVLDGQTVLVQPAARGAAALKVQLQGVDAPEPCQSGAAQAKDALAQRVERKTVQVTLASSSGDSAGVVRGKLSLKGQDVGAALVREGWVWREGKHYTQEERQAMADKRGVHAAKKAMSPVEFRRRYGPCHAFAPGGARAPQSAASRSEPEWLDPPTEDRINNGSSLSY